MQTILTDILGVVAQFMPLLVEINQDDVVTFYNRRNSRIISLYSCQQRQWIFRAEIRYQRQVGHIGDSDTRVRSASLQAAEQEIEVVSVTVEWHIVCQVVDGEPDRHQVGVGIERYRNFDAQRLVQCDRRDAEVDQVNARAKISGQQGGPILSLRIICPDTKGIRSPNRHIRQSRLWSLLHRQLVRSSCSI